jgi:hypothetical protein
MDKDARLSSHPPSIDVAGAQDYSWATSTLIYLAVKPSHVGVDVDGLAYILS